MVRGGHGYISDDNNDSNDNEDSTANTGLTVHQVLFKHFAHINSLVYYFFCSKHSVIIWGLCIFQCGIVCEFITCLKSIELYWESMTGGKNGFEK